MLKQYIESETTILIVDDEQIIIDIIENLLKDEGYQIMTSNSGDDCYIKAEKSGADLIILDMKIPKMDGYVVIGRLKEDADTKDIPVLIMSGHEVETDRLKKQTMKKSILYIGHSGIIGY